MKYWVEPTEELFMAALFTMRDLGLIKPHPAVPPNVVEDWINGLNKKQLKALWAKSFEIQDMGEVKVTLSRQH